MTAQEAIKNEEELNEKSYFAFARDAYRDLCIEMREVLMQEKEIASKKEELRNGLIALSGGDRMEYGIKLQKLKAKGTIDYKKALDDLGVSEEELESYRKAEREYWKVCSY